MFLDPDKPIRKHCWGVPHWHQDGTFVFVTWRLADSLPRQIVARILAEKEAWLKRHPKPWDRETAIEHNRRFVLSLEDELDEGHGACVLTETGNQKIVADALFHVDQERYHLSDFVIMPNHVHLLLQLKEGFQREGDSVAKTIYRERDQCGDGEPLVDAILGSGWCGRRSIGIGRRGISEGVR